MPDALSKTIPVWCSVVNRFLFPELVQFHDVYTPPQVVAQSEHAQIAALLPSFLASLQALDLSIDGLRAQITKPLRPFWITPDTGFAPTSVVFEEFHPIICCTVSRRVSGGEVSEGGYIQGAGDDTENWACGLTPVVFWENQGVLLETSESDLPDLIQDLVSRADPAPGINRRCVSPTSCLYIAPISAVTASDKDVLSVLLLPKVTDESTWVKSFTRLEVGLGHSKLGSRNLRAALPFVVTHVRKYIATNPQSGIVIACESGKDFAVGVALALLCLLFDQDGSIIEVEDPRRKPIDKTFIRQRLGWISTSMPDANPNRATLQSINSFLMERHF
ncbi:hypothetical protein BP6252_07361 [Coleophoma cylindrospora]|uniref:Initiator tRNA phosphoribosyl transferase n=1 Tax=Coleophoma cylindrospora TaxID=1849047 RepID=A0A3D8RHT3_9HELO|nr:hypothetical protein BP6252_07361 [Coleophoma cylindrospora]